MLRAGVMTNDQEPWVAGMQKAGPRLCQDRPGSVQDSALEERWG